jgi:transposase-like protein
MGAMRQELIKKIIQEYNPKSVDDIHMALKDLLSETLEGMLNAELDEELGYSKYDYKSKRTDNTRNGSTSKKVKSKLGEIEVKTPRDRDGIFEPRILKKRQTDISGIDDQIISMYAKGMTNRDIETHINDIYGFNASPSLISRITDKVLPLAKEWQNRPLESVYAIMFLDAIHFNVRKDATVVKKAVYIAIGINLEGEKDVLGMWIGENESSRFWLNVVTEMRNRGVKDVLIASVDGLNGFSDAIRSVFPKTEIQRCILHQIRNSTKYISYKDLKEFMSDLKLVYKAATEDAALYQLDVLDEKWSKKYFNAVKSWQNNWDELSTYFKYPPEIRKLIYTTNNIENFNRQLRKVTKPKTVYPTDDSLLKTLYLAMIDATKKWTSRIQGWGQILDQLTIHFEGRV